MAMKVKIWNDSFRGRPCRFGQVFAVLREEGEDLIHRHLANKAPIIPPVQRRLEARDRIWAKAQVALDLQDVRAVLPHTRGKRERKRFGRG
jgi:hypothetical protein